MKRMIRPLAALAALTLSAPAFADVVASDCDWLQDMRNIAEPWESNTRTFYRGQLRVVHADSGEPACCSFHVLLLLSDPEDEMGGRKCVAIGQGPGMGFGRIDFPALNADYDPSTGLVLRFPYALFDPETSRMGATRRATVVVNMATGRVSAR